MSSNSSDYLSELHHLLNDYFNLAEIRTLCLDLNIDYESVAGEEKPSRIRELLLGLARHGRLPELLTLVAKKRPRTNWPPLPVDFQLPESLITGGAAAVQEYHVYGDVVHGDKITYEGLTVAEVAALMIELKNQDQPVVWNGRIPYLGLAAYQEADAQYFFGRESLVQELLKRVQEASFITIAGPSGSGKSSVARAGLFHALRQGEAIQSSDRWLLAAMQPKGEPIEQLAQAIERLTKMPDTGSYLRQEGRDNSLALHKQAETLLSEDPTQRFVLLVDQFEELFTQTKDTAVRRAFINLLTEAAQVEDSRCLILISLRSDFVSHCASHDKLRQLISQQFQLVGAMEPRDLAKAITLPALEVGAEIDAELVSKIIADMKGSPDALPLMSFALRDLFEVEKTEKGKPMDLTLGEYIDRGGLEKALEEHADKVFKTFTDEQQAIAKNIFSKLIEVGQGRVDTRRTATFAELVPADSNAEAVTAVLSHLATVRLITTSGLVNEGGHPLPSDEQDATITIAHEKMIDAWPWLRTLVDENRDLIALQNQINNDAKAWAKEEDMGFLYRGGRLLQMEEKLDTIKPYLDARSLQFIQASLDQREQEKQEAEANRQREEDLKSQKRIGLILRWATGIVGILLIVAVFSAFQVASEREAAIAAQSTSDVNAQLANESEIEARNAEGTAVFAQATSDFNVQLANESVGEARNAESTAIAAQATSVVNANIASTREAEVQQLKIAIQANQLAVVAQAELNNDPERALLLAVAGLGLNLQPNTHSQMANNLQTPYRMTLYGHEELVDSALFSADGQIILTASWDSTARLWDRAGNELTVLKGHEDFIFSASFSPDGQKILTASNDGTARLWDREGNELAILRGHGGGVDSAKFSPDGKTILTAGCDEFVLFSCSENLAIVRLWDVQGKELATFLGHEDYIFSTTFSADGQTILTASEDGTARLWNLSGDTLAIMRGHEGGINSVAFSPDGQTILTASDDGSARLWDIRGNELIVLSGHEDSVTSAWFSPDSQTILTASGDSSARLWDIMGNELLVLRGHEDWLNSAVFSPDGQTVLTASEDGTARLWDTMGNELAVLRGDKGRVSSAVFSPDGRTVLTASSTGRARLWDIHWNELILFEGHEGEVRSAVFSPNGQNILTASLDGTARLWDLRGKELLALDGHVGLVWSAVFSPDGQTFLTTSGNTAWLWDLHGNQLSVMAEHNDVIRSVLFSADGQTILTASQDGTARLWDRQGNELAVLSGHDAGINLAIFSPDENMILTASYDGTSRLWNRQGEELFVLNGHESEVYFVAFSPEGHTILTTGSDETVRVWDLQGNEKATLRGHRGSVYSAVFSPNGQVILSRGDEGTARLWNLRGEELTVLGMHESVVRSAGFNADGQIVLTASGDGTLRLWDIEGDVLAVLRGHEAGIWSAMFSPDKQTILTASDDSTARLWPNYSVEYMVSEAYRRLKRSFTEAECQQYFRDDLGACPRSKRELFEPLLEYLTLEQQMDWENLGE